MLNIPGIYVQNQIYESANSLVYRAKREADNQPIILKLLKENYPTPEEIARYRTEYEITKSLNFPGVVQVYDLRKYQNTLVMFLEDFGGESLKIWMEQHSWGLKKFLHIAIATTKILGKIHAANIIHKDINPANIVFNPTNDQIKIIDFGISTKLTRENLTIKNPNILEGTLAYMSPEQTGRMNRQLDYRTDFYSLGATFYHLLTNQLPFSTDDALELVHCHLAKQPVNPDQINPEIPPVVASIVMKLMAKTAEDRYQSALGIKADLEKCLQQLENNGTISDFTIGNQDISDKFQLQQKLYGRETEIEKLLKAFQQVSNQSQIILIAGYSGIGKTALVQEIYKPITEKRGYFISGKFDQYQKDIPYSAIFMALQSLVKQLLTESELQLKKWQEKILLAVGNNGQILIEEIPELELIIGKQPQVATLGINEAENRFNLVFQNFIQVFTQPEHPLVLFIDDLQWADRASLKLMQLLLNGTSSGLFLIGAYRDNEVTAGHPLMMTLEEISNTGSTFNSIFLSPLELETINQLVADTLKTKLEKTQSLAELIKDKTGGNPFFMNEFLMSIYEEKLLKFQYQQGNWYWEIEKIKSLGITDNLVELMAEKIHKLPDATENLLKLAACLGNKFELKILAQVSQISQQQTALDLQTAIAEGLLIPLTDSYKLVELNLSTSNTQSTIEYKFVHDKVQQAAYSLMSKEEKQVTHWNIGNLLLQHIPKLQQEKKIFDLVNQLNLGIKLISRLSESYEVANLNLIAAKKALTSAAYQPALSYLNIAIELLAKDGWKQCYDLTLEVYQQAARAAYLSSQFEQMEEFISEIKTQGKNLLDKLKADEIQILAYKNQNKSLDAIALALDNLEILGTKVPKNPQKYHVLLALLQTKLALIGKDIDKLVDLPMMTDAYKKTAMEFIASVSAAAYVTSPQIMLLIICKQVNLSIKYGNTPHAAFAYATYGLIQCSIVGNMELGAKFAQIAIKLIEKLNTQETKTKTLYIINCFIRHWSEPAIKSATSLLDIYKNGLETGDLQFTSFAAYVSCYYSYLAGKQLFSLEKRIASLTESPIIKNQVISLYNCQLAHQVVLNLMAESEQTYNLNGLVFSEEKIIPIYEETKYVTGLVYFYINKMMLCYIFGEYQQCLEYSHLAKKSLASVIGLMFVPVFYFYDSLIQLAVYDGDRSKQKPLLKIVKDNQKKMKKWAKSAPMNYQHKFYLVKAEVYRILGKQQKAMKFYDQAISTAKDHDYLQEAAMSYELAAKFYLSINQEIIAKAYMQESLYFYQFWGAIAKVKDLETKYSQLLTTTALPSQNSQTITSTSGSHANLDLATVMKSSQAISGEIELDKLLSNLMKIVIENVGAQTGYLILANQEKLTIAASGTIENERVAILQSIPLQDYQNLPHAIINYVKRTQEIVILHDANQEVQFSNDSYIKAEKPKSILCVPLINQGKLISIIYLENNLTTGAFTEERVEILKLLSSQAAISIENAQLYDNMAELNKAYERFVPGEFLQFLNKDSIVDVKLGDQIQLEMSVLFSDIRDFTTLSEKMTPEDNFKFINSYLSRMETPIINNHGFIDKYIGDAIMALFSGKADNAVTAGISMLKELVEYNQHRVGSGYPPIQIGIGINTGSLILGTVGCKNRMDSTVISDAVNLASRVESLTKNYGVSLLITEQTYKKLHYPNNYHLRIIDTVKVKGKSQAVTVYEVFDADLPEIKEGKLATLEIFTEALSLYNQGQLLESESMFRKCVKQNPGDRVANIYCQRCQN